MRTISSNDLLTQSQHSSSSDGGHHAQNPDHPCYHPLPAISSLIALTSNISLALAKLNSPLNSPSSILYPLFSYLEKLPLTSLFNDDDLPLYHRISPRLSETAVRYLHITECPQQYSIGIFVFSPGARIPIHDHPNMMVLSKLLYGSLEATSYDTVEGKEGIYSRTKKVLNEGDVSALFPLVRNIHSFRDLGEGSNGSAVLDIILPPYDTNAGRDCTFFRECRQEVILDDQWMIQNDREKKSDKATTKKNGRKKKGKKKVATKHTKSNESGAIMKLIKVDSPEIELDFHCVSGVYKSFGEDDDWQDENVEKKESDLMR
uniref:Cysteine dioxygenase n=1 Tax=Corethron hystrix TaxID=216773 RepID=A0A7S1BRR5_9STRA|mmetsp:Transcript_36567/g.85482  ORF Transcript_36567/g.85482 Transcript_36567/m.85482 type:complete len:318 (+) Transcript_36567:50-1003(+)